MQPSVISSADTMDSDSSKIKGFRPIRLTWSLGELVNEEANQLTCRVLSNRKNLAEVEKVVIENGKKVFVGERDESPLSNNYLVIRNRQTNKLRWYKTDNYLVQPYCPKRKITNDTSTPAENEGSKREAMLTLNRAMGSKKTKRRVLEAEKVNVVDDNVEKKLGKVIESKEIIVEEPENVSLACQDFPYLPPRDRNADSIERVYKVYDLISPDILESLEEVAEEILGSDLIKLAVDERLSSFFMKCYPRITGPDTTKVKLLLFADSLMKFLKEPARHISKSTFKICHYCDALDKKILDEFCAFGSQCTRTRPPSMRDKSFCYILVCLLLISNFVVDLSVFSGLVTEREFPKLSTLMRAVGATKERDSATTFRLKIPLAELQPTHRGVRKSGAFRQKR